MSYAGKLPVVVVPARNEEALLPRLLEGLARQTVLPSLADPLDVVVVLNNTDDRSHAVALDAVRYAPRLRLAVVDVDFPADKAHVGFARSLAMKVGSRKIARRDGVILTTDADAVPAADWIEANLRAIDAGADIVGGRIVGDRREEERLGQEFMRRAGLYARYADLCDQLASLIDPLDHDPWPRHHDHTGASLAVRDDVYRHVGGLDPLPFREDLGFVSKVQAAGFRLRHPHDVMVTVSARTIGRAPGGMADCLVTWLRAEESGSPALVECPASVALRLNRRRQLRDLRGAPSQIVERRLIELGLAPDGGVRSTIPQLIAQFAGELPDAEGTVRADHAILQLERMVDLQRGRQSDAA